MKLRDKLRIIAEAERRNVQRIRKYVAETKKAQHKEGKGEVKKK